MQSRGDIYKMPGYAESSSSETFAESFVFYHHERDKLPAYVVQAVEEIINAN